MIRKKKNFKENCIYPCAHYDSIINSPPPLNDWNTDDTAKTQSIKPSLFCERFPSNNQTWSKL